MSLALYNEIKGMRAQILNLLTRVEALEEWKQREAQEKAEKKRPILTLPPKAPTIEEFVKTKEQTRVAR
jgi:hypothetical protein